MVVGLGSMACIAALVAGMLYIAIRASTNPAALAKIDSLLGYVSGGGIAVGLLGAIYHLKDLVLAALQTGPPSTPSKSESAK